MDVEDGFYQVGLDEQSILKTTFWTPFGRYKYLTLPFGINLAPEEFERKLHEKLQGLPGVAVTRDNILVMGYGENEVEANRNHDENLTSLLEQARKAILCLNSSKLNLRNIEVKFMGHLNTKDGLKPDPEKIKAVQQMPRPTSKKELLGLLGFVNYLSKFLPKLSEVVQPLSEMTTKEAKFTWSQQHETAIKEVRELVVKHPVLKYYDVQEPVVMQCDASRHGLGAALLQKGQPLLLLHDLYYRLRDSTPKLRKSVWLLSSAKDLVSTLLVVRKSANPYLVANRCKSAAPYCKSQFC